MIRVSGGNNRHVNKSMEAMQPRRLVLSEGLGSVQGRRVGCFHPAESGVLGRVSSES